MEDGCETSYACPCGREFKRKATYIRHMDIAHSNAESHKCRICSKTFGNANTLRMHMNIHQDETNDAKLDRLTRSRKNRTPSGGRDKRERSGECNRTKSPHIKRDSSRNKDKAADVTKSVHKTQHKSRVIVHTSPLKTASVQCQTIKTELKDIASQPSVQESQSEATMQTEAAPESNCSGIPKTETDFSMSPPPVVVKTEPPSPPSLSDCTVSDPSASVSPGAKENILPQPSLTSHVKTEHIQDVKLNVSGAQPSGLSQTENKVRLIDSTNTVRLNLQESRCNQSTIVIKLEEGASKFSQQNTVQHQTQQDHCRVQGQQSVVLFLPDSLQATSVNTDAGTDGDHIVHQQPLQDGIDKDDDAAAVRKSIRLKGKTPGWKTWFEEEETSQSNRKDVCRKKIAKVKLEGEDYDIIEQVVDMSNELCMFSEDLPKTVAFIEDDNALTDGSQSLIKRREVNKNTIACPVCSKEFVSEKYLSMHMSLHRSSGSDQMSPSTNDDEEPPVKRAKPSSTGASTHWTCKICNKTFAQNSNFKNHIRTHSDERPFVCEICCIGFKERYHLKKHMLFKHSNELKEECRVCGKKFKDSTAVRAHERIHSDVRPYACRRCGKTFKTSECLWHHENRSKTCGTALDGVHPPSSRFRRGRQPRKVESNSVSVQREKARPPEVPPTIQRQQPVAHQMKGFKTEAAIPTTVEALEGVPHSNIHLLATRPDNVLPITRTEQHHINTLTNNHQLASNTAPVLVKIHQETPSPIISTTVDPQLPVVKVEQDLELPDYELAGLSSESSLDESSQDLDFNELIGSDDDSDEMGSSFSLEDMDIQSLDRQDVEPMSDSISRLCSAFGPDTLEIKADSLGKMRFFCVKCGKQFASVTAFEKHMATHSEMRPYKCTVCDIGFKLKVHLKKHNLYRHSNEYPCECSICGKKFKDSSAVKLHERIHSTDRPFKCDCGKSFKTRENLWGHRHRGPCEKKDLSGTSCSYVNHNPAANQAQVSIANGQISAHASVSSNEIIARAIVSNNTVMAKATIGNNGQLMASALIQGPKIHAQASADGKDASAHAHVGEKRVSANALQRLSVPVMQQHIPIPETVVALQAKDDASRPMATIAPRQQQNSCTLPTAVVAPIKHEKQASMPQQAISSPPLKVASSTPTAADKGLPPFETFAPTIMSILQRPPRLPPGVTLPHLQNKQSSNRNDGEEKMLKKVLTPSERCPTIQKHLQQNMPPPTKLPGIQQLFQSHSLAHANRQLNNVNCSARAPGSPRANLPSPNPYLRPPPSTPPTSSSDGPSLFSELPPPPPYPGNPNMGGPANTDYRAKTPLSLDGGPSPCTPVMYWDDDSNQDKKLVTCHMPWQSDADSLLFNELATGPAFGHL